MSPNVVDVFLYNGEGIVARRLKYLAPVVDRFVVIEAWTTHAGTRKDRLFVERDAAVFAGVREKVTFVVVDDIPDKPSTWGKDMPWVKDNGEAWWREWTQREACLPVLRGLAVDGPMVALVCDVDEIPRRATIEFMRANFADVDARPAVHLGMSMHYYSWNWTKEDEPWFKAFAITGRHLTRATGDSALTAIRNNRPTAALPDAGWHCSFFMDEAELRRKIESFAHRECDTPHLKNEIHIRSCAKTGADIFQRAGIKMVPTPQRVLDAIPPELADPDE
jgi:hypothetical protein